MSRMIWISEKISLTPEEIETLYWLKEKDHIYYLSQIQKRFKHTIEVAKNGDIYLYDLTEKGTPDTVIFDSIEDCGKC